jgi:hypothetical protein
MIPLRAYLIPIAVLLLIIAMGRARADGLPPGVTCDDVRAAQQVEAARRCLTRD